MLILFSAFCFAAGVWRDITPGQIVAAARYRPAAGVLLITVNGFLGLVALAALVGVWAG